MKQKHYANASLTRDKLGRENENESEEDRTCRM